MSLLASWVSDLAAAVAALDEGQERNEAEIGALSDAVDQIDARIDGIAGEEPDPLDVPDFDAEDSETLDLTSVPYVVDYDLSDNVALKGRCSRSRQLHCAAAAQARPGSQTAAGLWQAAR
jgi:hypothetical protein